MTPVLFALAAFISTFTGGITAIKNSKRLHYILGFTAGIIIGVIAFDLLPEIFRIVADHHLSSTKPMVMLVIGFLLFHIIEKSLLIHHAHEHEYGSHKHPHVGILSALALSGHSFLDGVGIGLGFQIDTTVGVAVALAVIGHDFADGLNTVTLMLSHKNPITRATKLLFLDAVAPIAGVFATKLFTLSDAQLVLYLGFFAGFLLYIGASDILPQAHEENSSRWTIALTVIGAAFMFVVTRFV